MLNAFARGLAFLLLLLVVQKYAFDWVIYPWCGGIDHILSVYPAGPQGAVNPHQVAFAVAVLADIVFLSCAAMSAVILLGVRLHWMILAVLAAVFAFTMWYRDVCSFWIYGMGIGFRGATVVRSYAIPVAVFGIAYLASEVRKVIEIGGPSWKSHWAMRSCALLSLVCNQVVVIFFLGLFGPGLPFLVGTSDVHVAIGGGQAALMGLMWARKEIGAVCGLSVGVVCVAVAFRAAAVFWRGVPTSAVLLAGAATSVAVPLVGFLWGRLFLNPRMRGKSG